jgi:hypothetical protein
MSFAHPVEIQNTVTGRGKVSCKDWRLATVRQLVPRSRDIWKENRPRSTNSWRERQQHLHSQSSKHAFTHRARLHSRDITNPAFSPLRPRFVSANVPLPRAQHATPSPSLNPPPNRATIRTVGLLFLFGGSMCTPDQARDAIVRSANAWPRLSRGYFVGSRINTPSNTAHLASKPSAFAHMVSAPGLFATQKTFFGGPFLKPPSPTFSHARSARLHAEALSSSLVRASPRH